MKASLFRLVVDNEPGSCSVERPMHTVPPITCIRSVRTSVYTCTYIWWALFRIHIMGRPHYDKLSEFTYPAQGRRQDY